MCLPHLFYWVRGKPLTVADRKPHPSPQPRVVIHALDRRLSDFVETPGHGGAVKNVRNVLLHDRQNTDRIHLLFRLRGRRQRSDDTLVSPRRRGGEPHVRWGKHMLASPCLVPQISALMLRHTVLYASALAVYMHTVLPSESHAVTIPPRPG